MTATIHLGDKAKSITASSPEDQFCVGHNAYCQVRILRADVLGWSQQLLPGEHFESRCSWLVTALLPGENFRSRCYQPVTALLPGENFESRFSLSVIALLPEEGLLTTSSLSGKNSDSRLSVSVTAHSHPARWEFCVCVDVGRGGWVCMHVYACVRASVWVWYPEACHFYYLGKTRRTTNHLPMTMCVSAVFPCARVHSHWLPCRPTLSASLPCHKV